MKYLGDKILIEEILIEERRIMDKILITLIEKFDPMVTIRRN